MGCLDNIVGVKGCGVTPSGVYVQQLPGITLSNFDKAISNEHIAATSALTDIIKFAAQNVEADIQEQLATKYELKTLIENSVLGYYRDDKQAVAAETGYLTGYQIRVDSTPYLSFYISNLSLFVNTSGTVNVLVYDLIQGKLLDTFPVTAVAGEIVTIDIEKAYATNKQRLNLFIGYASAFQSYQTSYYQAYTGWGNNEWCDCGIGGSSSNKIYFRPAKILSAAQKLQANIETNSYGAGISLGYSLQCSFTEHLCNMKNQLTMPLLYKAGQLIMQEVMNSTRLSGVIVNFADSYERLDAYYAGEYARLMKNRMKNLSMPDSMCFTCNKRVSTAVNLP